MNLYSILKKIGGVNTEDSQSQTRRESLLSFGNAGKNVVMAAVPAAILAGIPSTSNAKGSATTVIDVLNFALTLEYLESSFYNQGVALGVVPGADLAVFNQIKMHENTHVTVLQDTINALGGTPVTSPSFDFTAGGAFNPFMVYADFLALSQGFEDTGVRAYKGQAGNLISNNAVLTAALQIHSVEARHAAEVRRIRNREGFDPTAKAWITGNSRGTLPAAVQPTYNGEENTVQGGINVTSLVSFPIDAFTEAFDEPLTMSEVLAIASVFIV